MSVVRIGRLHWWMQGHRVHARCPECRTITIVDPGVHAGGVRPLLECGRCGFVAHVELLDGDDPHDPKELQTSAHEGSG